MPVHDHLVEYLWMRRARIRSERGGERQQRATDWRVPR
jgi:hypothetical protein